MNDFLQQHTGVAWPLAGGSGDTYFGATIGRYANWIGAHAFTMTCSNCSNNGVTYTLPANNGTATLHDGDLGWNTKVWGCRSADRAGLRRVEAHAGQPGRRRGLPGRDDYERDVHPH